MPKVIIHKLGAAHEGEVKDNANLVVRAGIRQFPYPHLRYGCGMGKCSKCASEVIAGAEHLPPPNWKEQKVLGANLARGYRLLCQIWVTHDIEIRQDSDEVWAATIKPKLDAAGGPSAAGSAAAGSGADAAGAAATGKPAGIAGTSSSGTPA